MKQPFEPPTPERLQELYLVEKRPMHQIAKDLGIAIGTVHNYLRKYGIETRKHADTFTFKGRMPTQEHRNNLSKALTGRKVSAETRAKQSYAQKDGGIGHKKKRGDGYTYIYFPDHPKSTKDGYIMEHDLVMECLIGRHLREDEVVHHKNRDRADNRKENLQLMTRSEHTAHHMRERKERTDSYQ